MEQSLQSLLAIRPTHLRYAQQTGSLQTHTDTGDEDSLIPSSPHLLDAVALCLHAALQSQWPAR